MKSIQKYKHKLHRLCRYEHCYFCVIFHKIIPKYAYTFAPAGEEGRLEIYGEIFDREIWQYCRIKCFAFR